MFTIRRSISETFVSSLVSVPAGQLGPVHPVSRRTTSRSASVLFSQDTSDISVPPTDFEGSKSYDADLFEHLLSLPIMRPLVEVVKKRSGIENGTSDLEDALLFAVEDAMQDLSSPWAKLVPKPPPVVGPRTPEQYHCALNIAIRAQKAAKEKSKVAKFWKQEASKWAVSLGQDIPLTPSPSDISDTGLSEPLSPSRRKRVVELMARRRIATIVSERNTNVNSFSKELDKTGDTTISDVSRIFDSGSVTCVSLSASPEPTCAEHVGFNASSDNCRSEKLSSLAKSRIPSLKRHQTAPLQTPPPLPNDSGAPRAAKIVTRQHTCCKKSRKPRSENQSSRPTLSSVQTKCRLYESLASHPSSTPARSIPSTQTSISNSIKSRLDTKESKPASVRPPKGTPKTPQPPLSHVAIPETSCLPQAHRG